MHVDEKLVSTDGFLINQTVALIRLCEPFMDPKGSKVRRLVWWFRFIVGVYCV